MSFGLNDKDWVDPPEVEEGKPRGATCLDCGSFRASPCGDLGYCTALDEWYYEDDDEECSEWLQK